MKLNIVVPMAGHGSRFKTAGYQNPKPLIQIHGVPMIKIVIDNIRPVIEHRFIFICLRSHFDDYGLVEKFNQWAPGSEIIVLDSVTQGAACTVLKAKELIDTDAPLMIANSDQYVDININLYLEEMKLKAYDDMIMTMTASDRKWSYAALNSENLVQRVAEKEPISNEATVGIYNFSHGCDFVSAAESMISQHLHVNGEYYVCPVYNELVKRGHRIGVYNIGRDGYGLHGLGTPEDLNAFLDSPISSRVLL